MFMHEPMIDVVAMDLKLCESAIEVVVMNLKSCVFMIGVVTMNLKSVNPTSEVVLAMDLMLWLNKYVS